MPPKSHTPFAVFNRTLNPLIAATLRSPAHRMLDRNLLLISVKGRRSGKTFTFPVGYKQDGDRITIPVVWPERKYWWRNLRGAGAPVQLVLRGESVKAHARATGDDEAGVKVEVELSG